MRPVNRVEDDRIALPNADHAFRHDVGENNVMTDEVLNGRSPTTAPVQDKVGRFSGLSYPLRLHRLFTGRGIDISLKWFYKHRRINPF